MFQIALYRLDNKMDMCYSIGATEEMFHVKEKN